jgi:hypothetical protein
MNLRVVKGREYDGILKNNDNATFLGIDREQSNQKHGRETSFGHRIYLHSTYSII